MKKSFKLFLVLSGAVASVALLGYFGLATQPDVSNLVRYHQETHDPSTGEVAITSQECIKCHGDKRTEASQSNYYVSAHKRHNMSVYFRLNLLTPYDNDGDGKANEDLAKDMNGDGAPGIAGVDDDGDGLIDEPGIPYSIADTEYPYDDDEDGIDDEDPVESECVLCHQATDTSLGQAVTNERGDINPGMYNRQGSYEGGLLDYENPDDPPSYRIKRVARKQVNPELCLSCHGIFRVNKTIGNALIPEHIDAGTGQNIAETNPTGCKKCHRKGGPAGDPLVDLRHVPYVHMRYAELAIACFKCHGAYQWFDTPETNYFESLGGFPPYW